ncbi:tryptophan-rich sensory protein [Maribacter sp. 2307ULW6-5]|uniref:tryptophan-rich sensory protein n=1 Tax=Maribacter sp. 2307ULW6-5 TaxID=3386275 RepID=UPI0039BCC44E
MKKTLAILNLLSVLAVIAVNYVSQALRFNDTTIGDISQKYNNLFTPASYAFAIWGLIFLGLLAYGIFQVYRAFFTEETHDFMVQTGYWFVAANVLNALWVFAFVYEHTGLSVLIMLGILLSLIKVILNTNMERWHAPKKIIVFVWWPICLYAGWISVATIANISAYLTKLGWEGAPFSEEVWTIVMIVVATGLNLIVIHRRNMREFAAVGVWALFAIFIRHREAVEPVAYTALVGSVVIFAHMAWHGFKNRKGNPFFKGQ